MNVTKPYHFLWFGDIHGPKPYEFMKFRWALISQTPVFHVSDGARCLRLALGCRFVLLLQDEVANVHLPMVPGARV